MNLEESGKDNDNIDSTYRQIGELHIFRPDIICLSYDFANTRNEPEEVTGPVCRKLSILAYKLKSYIATSFYERDEFGRYICSVLINRKGKLIGKYHQIHISAGEKKYYKLNRGEQLPVFNVDFGKIGLVAGFDFFFPEVWGILSLEKAEIVLWIAESMLYGPTQMTVETLLKSRALDYCVTVATANYGCNPPYPIGRMLRESCIINNEGVVIARSGFRPGIAEATVNLDQRKEVFDGEYKTPVVYKDLISKCRKPWLYNRITRE